MRLFNFCVKPNTLKMAATKKNLRKSLGKPGNVIATPEVGGRKYTSEVNFLYQKEAYMVRNKRFYSSGRLRRPWWRCLQNKSTHISKCVSLLQRRMREDRKRDSKEEAGVFRRSRWISLKKTMYQTEGCGKFFKNYHWGGQRRRRQWKNWERWTKRRVAFLQRRHQRRQQQQNSRQISSTKQGWMFDRWALKTFADWRVRQWAKEMFQYRRLRCL